MIKKSELMKDQKKMHIFVIFKCKTKKKNFYWTKEEDQLLLLLTKDCRRKDWISISQKIMTKSAERCKCRYHQINPKISHLRWCKAEDQLVLRLVKSYGFNWNLISKVMKNRSGKQIRSRYVNYIFEGINKSQFSEIEDKQILNNFQVFKNNWIKYCPLIPNRSPRQIEIRAKYLLKI